MAKHDVTNTPFSQKYIDGFFLNFGGRRQVDAGEGIESLRRYLPPFLSYRENPAGGKFAPPPQRGAG